MRTLPAAALLGIALFSVACGDAADTGEHTEATASAIIAGTPSGADDDSVVAIGAHSKLGPLEEVCSGSLVAPNLVLTARHCVSVIQAGDVGCTPQGKSFENGGVVEDHAPSELHIYIGKGAGAVAESETKLQTPMDAAHGVQVITDGATSICNHDVALIVLDHDIVGTYAPLHFDEPSVNELVTIVGFGLTEMGTLPADRLKTQVVVGTLGPWTSPTNSSSGFGDGEIQVSEGACKGDSGGPMLDANHGVLALASRVGGGDGTGPASSCYGKNAWGIYASIGSKRPLIESGFAAAGKPMWLEGDPNPFTVAPAATPPFEDPTPAADPAPVTTTTTSGCNTSGGAPIDASAFVVLLGLVVAARRRVSGASRD